MRGGWGAWPHRCEGLLPAPPRRRSGTPGRAIAALRPAPSLAPTPRAPPHPRTPPADPPPPPLPEPPPLTLQRHGGWLRHGRALGHWQGGPPLGRGGPPGAGDGRPGMTDGARDGAALLALLQKGSPPGELRGRSPSSPPTPGFNRGPLPQGVVAPPMGAGRGGAMAGRPGQGMQMPMPMPMPMHAGQSAPMQPPQGHHPMGMPPLQPPPAALGHQQGPPPLQRLPGEPVHPPGMWGVAGVPPPEVQPGLFVGAGAGAGEQGAGRMPPLPDLGGAAPQQAGLAPNFGLGGAAPPPMPRMPHPELLQRKQATPPRPQDWEEDLGRPQHARLAPTGAGLWSGGPSGGSNIWGSPLSQPPPEGAGGWGAPPRDDAADWHVASMRLKGGQSSSGANEDAERLGQSLGSMQLGGAGGAALPSHSQGGEKNAIDELINIMDSPGKMEKLKEEVKGGVPSPQVPQQRQLMQMASKSPPVSRQRAASDGAPSKMAFTGPKMDHRELSAQLERLCHELEPTRAELAKKDACYNKVKSILAQHFTHFTLHIFGSGASNLCIRDNNDLDMCIEVRYTSRMKRDLDHEREVVERMGKLLEAAGMEEMLVLPHARVPIVKFTDPDSKTKCDICVNNLLAVYNTQLLRTYSLIDPRLRQLVFVVKHWAKRRQINEAYRGTLSSYAYVIMCIHVFQTQDPPILPRLQEERPTVDVQCGEWRATFCGDAEKFQGYGARNPITLGQLLFKFLEYWASMHVNSRSSTNNRPVLGCPGAWGHSYTDGVVSIRTGGWLTKAEKGWTKRVGNERHLICIEDPFQLAHDLGRVVDRTSIRVLRDEFIAAYSVVLNNPNPLPKLLAPYKKPAKNSGKSSNH